MYKIGRSGFKNIHTRFKQLKVGVSPEHLTNLCRVSYVDDSYCCEKTLHKSFKSQRLPQSEWFCFENDDPLREVDEFLDMHCIPEPPADNQVGYADYQGGHITVGSHENFFGLTITLEDSDGECVSISKHKLEEVIQRMQLIAA